MIKERLQKLSKSRFITLLVTLAVSFALIVAGCVVALSPKDKEEGKMNVRLNTMYTIEKSTQAYFEASASQNYVLYISQGRSYLSSIEIYDESQTLMEYIVAPTSTNSFSCSRGETYKIVFNYYVASTGELVKFSIR